MAWGDGHAFRLALPAVDNVGIRREAVEGFPPFGTVVSLQDVVERCLELLVGCIGIAFDRRFLQRPVQAFDLAIGPRRARLGEARLAASLRTGIIAGLEEGEACRLLHGFPLVCRVTAGCQLGELGAVRRPHRGALVGHGGAERTPEVGGDPARRLRMPLGASQLARPLGGADKREPACCRVHLGPRQMDVAQRRLLQRALGRRGAFPLREAAEAVALVAAVPRGPGPVREAVVQGREAVIQGPQGRPATRDAHRFRCWRQPRGTRLLRPPRRLRHGRASRPRGHGLWVDGVALGERVEPLLTLWDRATHGRGRAGAAVESWSRKASRDGTSASKTPLHPGTKHLPCSAPREDKETTGHGLRSDRNLRHDRQQSA
jgi:hypothetical protein